MNRKKYAGPAAGQRRDGVHLRFVLHPDRGADRGHDRLRQRAIGGADARRRIQPGGAEAVQRRPIRHGAHDRDVRPEPARERRMRDARRDRYQQGLGVSARCGARLSATARIMLRLDGEDHHFGARDGAGIVCGAC